MKRFSLGLLFPLFLQAGEIEKVVQSAFAKSWEVQNADYVRQNNQDDFRNKALSFFPVVTATTDAGFERKATSPTNNSNTADYAIEAKSILFSMDQIDDISISRATRDMQNMRYHESVNQFCLDVANLYLSYLVEKKKSLNTTQILEILNKQFDITSSEYRQGLKPRKDYLQLRAELHATELDQLNQSLSLKSAEDKLRDKIGADFEKFNFNPASLEVPQETLTEDENEKDSVLVKSLQREIDSLRKKEDKSRHQMWPKLVFTADYKLSDSNYWYDTHFAPHGSNFWFASLGLTYTLWDWGTQRRTEDSNRRGFIMRENEVYQSIRNNQYAADLVRQQIKVARRVYSARSLLLGDQRESFGLISRDYREGKITFIDYVSSLRAFGSAQLDVFSGLVDLNKSYFGVLLHKGVLDDYFKVR